MKMKNGILEKETSRGRSAGFIAKAALLGAVAGAGCVPDITIRNIPYDPNAQDAGCTSKSSCLNQTLTLRESGSSAGPNEVSVGNATLSLVELKDSGSTKAAYLQLEGCGYKANATFSPGASSVLTIGADSFLVRLESMEYDSAGLKLKVAVSPVCNGDGGLDSRDGTNKPG
jgi:hypothetical protein